MEYLLNNYRNVNIYFDETANLYVVYRNGQYNGFHTVEGAFQFIDEFFYDGDMGVN